METLPSCRPQQPWLPQARVLTPATLTCGEAGRTGEHPRHGTACAGRNEWDCHLKCEEHIGPDSLQIWDSAFQSQKGKQCVSALPSFTIAKQLP